MIMVKEVKLLTYYLGHTFKEKKMKKLIMMLLMIGFGYSQSLPQPIIVGEELDYPTLKISQFVKVDESVGIRDDKVSLGIKQLVEESFQDTRYRLVEDDNADFTANVVRTLATKKKRVGIRWIHKHSFYFIYCGY